MWADDTVAAGTHRVHRAIANTEEARASVRHTTTILHLIYTTLACVCGCVRATVAIRYIVGLLQK